MFCFGLTRDLCLDAKQESTKNTSQLAHIKPSITLAPHVFDSLNSLSVNKLIAVTDPSAPIQFNGVTRGSGLKRAFKIEVVNVSPQRKL